MEGAGSSDVVALAASQRKSINRGARFVYQFRALISCLSLARLLRSSSKLEDALRQRSKPTPSVIS